MTMESVPEEMSYVASPFFAKLALAVAACVLSTTTSAEELFNVAQTSLGAMAVTIGAPCNKDWPGLRAIPKEDPRNMRGGTLFGAPMDGGTLVISLIAPCAIERVDLMQLDYHGTMCVKKAEIAVDGKVVKTVDLEERPGKYQEIPIKAKGTTVSIKCISTYPKRKLPDGKEGPAYGGWARVRVMSTTDVAALIVAPKEYSVAPIANAVMPTGTGSRGAVEVHGKPRMSKGHPCTTWDKEDVARFRAMMKTSETLRGQASALRVAMDRRIAQSVAVPQPVKGADGKWEHISDSKVGKTHNNLSLDIANLGTAYQLFGDEKYAEYARKLLIAYADAWPNYGVGARHGFSHDPSKVFDQRLSDATWLIQVAIGYDFVRESKCFSDADRRHIADDLVAGSGRFIRQNRAHLRNATNWSAICTAAILAAGLACDDEDLVNTALYGLNWTERKGKTPLKWWEGTPNPQPSGVELHFSGKSIDVDGMWCEGAMGYQFMALQALVVDAEMLWHHGIDLYRYRGCALKCVFDSPLYFSYPNLVSPAIHDSGNASLVGYNSDLYEYGYLRYRDPKYLEVLRRIKRRLMAGFQLFTISTLYDVDLSSSGEVVAPESVNLNGVGYGVLRVTDGEGTRNLLLDYGPNRSHGHPDKLNIDLWAFGALQVPDPGTAWYEDPIYRNWFHTTFAHNTLNVDMQEQAPCGAELLTYAAGDAFGLMRGRTDEAYPGVTMDRSLFMTRGYVADLFTVVGMLDRVYDLTWHPRGSCEGVSGEAKSFSLPEPRSPGYNELKDMKSVSGASGVVAKFRNNDRELRLLFAGGEDTEFVFGKAQPRRELETPIFERRKTKSTVFGNVIDISGSGFVREVRQSGGLEKGYATLVLSLADGGRDFCYASIKDGSRTIGGVETDAQQAFVSLAKDGTMRAIAFAGGTKLKAGRISLGTSVPGSAVVERTETGSVLVRNCGASAAKVSLSIPEGKSFELKAGETKEIVPKGAKPIAEFRKAELKRLAEEAAAKEAKIAAEREAQAKKRRGEAAKLPAPKGFKAVVQAEDFSAQGGGEVRISNNKTAAVGDSIFKWDNEGHWLEWKVSVPKDAYYQVLLCGCADKDRTREVAVNGEPVVELGAFSFPATGGFSNGNDDWRLVAIPDPADKSRPMTFRLRHGENTIRMTNVGGGGLNVDYIVVADPNTKVERIK